MEFAAVEDGGGASNAKRDDDAAAAAAVTFATGRKRMRAENLRKLQQYLEEKQTEYDSKKNETDFLARDNERLRVQLDMLEMFVTQAVQLTLPDNDASFEELRLLALSNPDICPTVRMLLEGMAPASCPLLKRRE